MATMHRQPLPLRDETGRFANEKGNVYYPDIAPEVKDDLWRRFTYADL